MRPSRRDWNQRRRADLYGEQNGLCYWCEEPMVLMLRYPKDGRLAGDACTLDHLRDRENPRRREQVSSHKDQRLVAACCACNHQRDRARQMTNLREMRA